MKSNHWITLGAALAALAIGMGAFGAHALRSRLIPGGTATAESLRQLEVFETAARYQMYHALALVLVGLMAQRRHSTALQAAGGLFAVGVVLFCGSLYALVLTGIKLLGAITPLGGVAFILGWLMLAVAARQKNDER
ncbi:MAG TPA: DUF423 domain-containing protein [Pirellulales bacterium]|jgi:uncharacterized membrane protein YgdD (TMEM256/DUF423 family)|nr:DUF423 domain-containing protein [Pirellulales bacterium]